jgi:hypothetical protein
MWRVNTKVGKPYIIYPELTCSHMPPFSLPNDDLSDQENCLDIDGIPKEKLALKPDWKASPRKSVF